MVPVGDRANFESVHKFHVTFPKETAIFSRPNVIKILLKCSPSNCQHSTKFEIQSKYVPLSSAANFSGPLLNTVVPYKKQNSIHWTNFTCNEIWIQQTHILLHVSALLECHNKGALPHDGSQEVPEHVVYSVYVVSIFQCM